MWFCFKWYEWRLAENFLLLLFSENDFIIMVENIDVPSHDKKKFDDLIQVGFQEKELLNMTLSKAQWKPSEELEIELRNVPAMKGGEIFLAMVFRNKTNCMNEENSVIKCYDIIEKVIDIFWNYSWQYQLALRPHFTVKPAPLFNSYCFVLLNKLFSNNLQV